MNYRGVVIQESLESTDVLRGVTVIGTEVEAVIDKHQTPWLARWTLHTVEIPEARAEEFAAKLSKSLEAAHSWYADFKNDARHFIIFRGRVFSVDRRSREQYDEVKRYGVSLGIPEYQVDFSTEVVPTS